MWTEFAVVLSVVSVVVACTLWVQRTLGRLERRLNQLDLRLSAVEHQNRAFLKVFPQMISSLVSGRVVSSEQGFQMMASAVEAMPLPEFVRGLQPTVNPLTASDVERMQDYAARLRRAEPLTPAEAHDFARIADVITQEYPTHEGSWMLFMIAAVLVGLVASKK